MIIAFVADAYCLNESGIDEIVKEQIRLSAVGERPIDCYFAWNSEFDSICVNACAEMKAERRIKLIYVAPNLSLFREIYTERIKELGLFDDSFHLSLGTVAARTAIENRNAWMLEQADMAITYLTPDAADRYGLNRLIMRGKTVINIYDSQGGDR